MKPSNAQVSRFKQLDDKIKEMTAEKEEIRQVLLDAGTCSTKDFIVMVEDAQRESIAGMPEFRKSGLEDLIREKGLVKATSFRKVTVRSKKAG